MVRNEINRHLTNPPVYDLETDTVLQEAVRFLSCLLYTSDAADDLLCVDLGGRRIIKKKQDNRNDTRLRLTTT